MNNKIKQLLREGLLTEIMYHGSKYSEINFHKRDDNIDMNMLGYGLYTTNAKQEAIQYAKSDNDKGYLYTIGVTNGNILPWKGKLPDNLINTISKDPDFFNALEKIDVDIEDYEITIGDDTYDWDLFETPQENIKKGWAIYLNGIDLLVSGLTKEELIPTLMKILKGKGISIYEDMDIDENIFYGLPSEMRLNTDNIFNSLAHLSTYLYIKLGSLKKVSEYLVKHGVDGTKYGFEDDYGMTSSSDFEGSENTPTEVVVIYNPSKIKIKSKQRL